MASPRKRRRRAYLLHLMVTAWADVVGYMADHPDDKGFEQAARRTVELMKAHFDILDRLPAGEE